MMDYRKTNPDTKPAGYYDHGSHWWAVLYWTILITLALW